MPRKIGCYSMARDTVENTVHVTNLATGTFEGRFSTWEEATGHAVLLRRMDSRRARLRARGRTWSRAWALDQVMSIA